LNLKPSFAAGSIPWLLGHELRLALRARSKRQGRTLLVLAIVLAALMLFAGVPLGLFLRYVTIGETPGVLMTLDLILFAVFTLILSQTLASAVTGFYERGDLDLLLSSPLPPRRVLTVRALGIAVAPLIWFASLLSVVVIPTAVLGQPRWLTAYPVLLALAMLASAAGMSLAMGLIRLIGPRRTRTVGQLLAALIGAGFFLFGQLRNMLPDHGRDFFAGAMRWADSGVFARAAPLAWPARAVLGDLLPLAAFVGGSALLFSGVVWGLGRRFASDAGRAAGVGSGPARPSAARQPRRRGFEGGPDAALMRKELRLLVRDPTLLSQVLLRVLYILPLGFALVHGASGPHHRPDTFAFAGGSQITLTLAVVFVAGQLAGSLAWITICAEDAPDLLACAPIDGSRARWAKLWAAMVPVGVLLTPFLLVLTWLMPWSGLCAALGAAGSAISAGMINLWFEKPASRKAFRGRRTGSIMTGVAEVLVGLGWGVTAGVAASGRYWFLAVAPLALTIGMLVLARTLARPTRGY
jgi:ABC-2 type transport system permease protein